MHLRKLTLIISRNHIDFLDEWPSLPQIRRLTVYPKESSEITNYDDARPRVFYNIEHLQLDMFYGMGPTFICQVIDKFKHLISCSFNLDIPDRDDEDMKYHLKKKMHCSATSFTFRISDDFPDVWIIIEV